MRAVDPRRTTRIPISRGWDAGEASGDGLAGSCTPVGDGVKRAACGGMNMDARVSIDADRATSALAQSGRDGGTIVPTSWFACLVKDLWPRKPAVALEQYAGLPDRTARAYTNGDREPSASVLRDLLRGNEGYRVLVWIMAGFTPTWWLVVQHERAVYARLKELSPALRGIIDGIEA